MRARPLSLVATAALTLLVLSACSPPGPAPSENDPQDGNTQPPEAGTLPAVRSPSANLMSAAARNAPRAGSVTQGSRAEAGTTADHVRWTGDGVWIEGFHLTKEVTGEIDPHSGMRYFTDSGHTAVAAVVSRNIAAGPAMSRRRRTSTPNDPVVFGPWMYRTAGGLVWGMFADGLVGKRDCRRPRPRHLSRHHHRRVRGCRWRCGFLHRRDRAPTGRGRLTYRFDRSDPVRQRRAGGTRRRRCASHHRRSRPRRQRTACGRERPRSRSVGSSSRARRASGERPSSKVARQPARGE